jgi:predicted phosphodiesterase
MKLYAISDLHLGYEANRRALSGITSRPADWLILAGDVGETAAHLELAFRELKPRFAKLVWVPGNHELWTLPGSNETARGRFKYDELVELCRSHGVLTPEDPYPIVTIAGREVRIAPLFLLSVLPHIVIWSTVDRESTAPPISQSLSAHPWR